MIYHAVLLVGGVAALYYGAEWLVRGSARLASNMGVSAIVVGLTVVSFGTSAPELVVAVVSAVRNVGDLAMGNVLGSNLANIGLILGLTAVIRPLEVSSRVVSREVPFMLILTVCVYPLLLDLRVSRVDGFILLLVLVGYLMFVFLSVESEAPAVLGEYESFMGSEEPGGEVVSESQQAAPLPERSWKDLARDPALVALGSLSLLVGGQAIVEGATYLARVLGVSDVVIGLTVVAIGTSLPELATSLVAALRGEADIAVGNVIGSNIFNLAAVLGAAAAVRPFTVSRQILSVELPAVILLSALILPMAWGSNRIRRSEGVILLVSYVLVGLWVFWP